MLRPLVLFLLALAAPLVAQRPIRIALQPFELEMSAEWSPLTGTLYGLERRLEALHAPSIAADRAAYDERAFEPLLPDGSVRPGDMWRIDVRDVLPFLRQLHPGATAELHHDRGAGVGARGAFACLVGFDEQHAEVLLRVHADFLLEGDGGRANSAWLTPAQFEGRLVVDREAGRVVRATLLVPDATANVDVNVATDDGVLADIGRVRLGLAGGIDVGLGEAAQTIGLASARSALVGRFYPLFDVGWLPLERALVRSRELRRPLHVVVLFGSLLDESC